MSAFTKAQRCFALARSTTFAGEREAAIARGIAVYLQQTSPATGETGLIVLTRATARSLGGLLLEIDR